MAPGWTGFLALTAVLLTVMLVLARRSQGALERPPGLPSPDRDSDDSAITEGNEGPPLGWEAESARDTGHGEAGDDSGALEPTGAPADRGREFALDSLSPAALLANVALTHGLFAVVLVGGAWYFAIPQAAFGVGASFVGTLRSDIVIGGAFGAALWAANEAGAWLADAIGVGYDESLRHRLAPESVGGWILLLGVVLPLIAVGEELLFRGALIGVPSVAFGTSPWALAVVSSGAFALGHGAQGRVGIVVTGLLGFVLAAGFVVTGSLLVVILAHYVVNALEFLVHEGPGSGPAGK